MGDDNPKKIKYLKMVDSVHAVVSLLAFIPKPSGHGEHNHTNKAATKLDRHVHVIWIYLEESKNFDEAKGRWIGSSRN